MSFYRQINLSIGGGIAAIALAYWLANGIGRFHSWEKGQGPAELVFPQIVFGIGAVLVWLAYLRLYFRLVWFGAKQNESTLWDGRASENIKRSTFARWLIGVDRSGH